MARRDRRRATWGALGVSLLVHLVILIVLAREVAPGFGTPPSAEGDFQIALVRREPPPALEPTPAPQPVPRPARPRPERTRTPPAPARPTPRPRPVQAIQARPAPPRARPAPAAPSSRAVANVPAAGAANGSTQGGAASSGEGRWAVQGEDEPDAGVRRVLRATVGCSHEDFVQLRPDERAECDRRTGREARLFNGSGDMTDPQKRAAFIAATQAQERARAARTGPIQDVMTPCKGAANLGGGCVNTPFRHGNGGP